MSLPVNPSSGKCALNMSNFLCMCVGSAEEYRLPFTEYLDTDEEPTFSQMREIVVEQQKQLQLPEKYHNDEVGAWIYILCTG